MLGADITVVGVGAGAEPPAAEAAAARDELPRTGDDITFVRLGVGAFIFGVAGFAGVGVLGLGLGLGLGAAAGAGEAVVRFGMANGAGAAAAGFAVGTDLSRRKGETSNRGSAEVENRGGHTEQSF